MPYGFRDSNNRKVFILVLPFTANMAISDVIRNYVAKHPKITSAVGTGLILGSGLLSACTGSSNTSSTDINLNANYTPEQVKSLEIAVYNAVQLQPRSDKVKYDAVKLTDGSFRIKAAEFTIDNINYTLIFSYANNDLRGVGVVSVNGKEEIRAEELGSDPNRALHGNLDGNPDAGILERKVFNVYDNQNVNLKDKLRNFLGNSLKLMLDYLN